MSRGNDKELPGDIRKTYYKILVNGINQYLNSLFSYPGVKACIKPVLPCCGSCCAKQIKMRAAESRATVS